MTVQGIILDVDGTLVSSNDAHAHAWVEAFSNFGYDIAFDQVRPLIGMGGDQVIPRLVPELNAKEGIGKQITDRRKELIIHKFGAQLEPTPGARDLVQKLHDEGLNLIVATSATEQEMDILLNVAQVNDLVSDYTTANDAENSKPDPGIVEAALSKAHLSPDRALMLGDTPYDIESAGKAGVGVIAFRTGGFSDQQLQGAIAIYDNPADLLNHYDSSPLAAANQNGPSMSVSDLAESAAQTAEQAKTDMADNWQSFQTKASTWLDQATTNMASFFRQNGSLLSVIGWALLAVVGIRMLFALLHVLDNIPVITPLLELIGFAYVVWFIRRYLIRVQDRQELGQTLNRYKTDILGQ